MVITPSIFMLLFGFLLIGSVIYQILTRIDHEDDDPIRHFDIKTLFLMRGMLFSGFIFVIFGLATIAI